MLGVMHHLHEVLMAWGPGNTEVEVALRKIVHPFSCLLHVAKALSSNALYGAPFKHLPLLKRRLCGYALPRALTLPLHRGEVQGLADFTPARPPWSTCATWRRMTGMCEAWNCEVKRESPPTALGVCAYMDATKHVDGTKREQCESKALRREEPLSKRAQAAKERRAASADSAAGAVRVAGEGDPALVVGRELTQAMHAGGGGAAVAFTALPMGRPPAGAGAGGRTAFGTSRPDKRHCLAVGCGAHLLRSNQACVFCLA
ncbi:hypothetical protein FOA52_007135 [Chlamydomonas sp. UWO 241]|nr:hypothetical protein FOA52_007135 [Chlamydomonas sp. UWO 241]